LRFFSNKFLFDATLDSNERNQLNGDLENKEFVQQYTEDNILENQEQEVDKVQVAAENSNPEPAITEKSAPNYDIAYELSNVRYDGGKNYYVLVSSIDPASSAFKGDMKTIIKKIVSEKGNKISVDILDDKATMDIYYRSHYASNQLGRVISVSERNQIGIHLIASYNGEFEMGTYLNGLDFFPGANEDDSKVGGYVESLEFDASE
jgi:hypothetical protein